MIDRFLYIISLHTFAILLRLNNSCFGIVGPDGMFMLLSEDNQFFSKCFFFLAMSKLSRMRYRLFVAWNVDTVFFFPFPLVIFRSFNVYVICIISGGCNQSSSVLFLCYLLIVLWMYRRYLESWRVLFAFIFLTHTIRQLFHWNVKPDASSLIFLYSGKFV